MLGYCLALPAERQNRPQTNRLTPKPQSFSFPKILSLTGSLTQNPDNMAVFHKFHKFYSTLYQADTQASSKELIEFREGISLPKLASAHNSDLEEPITESEVLEVIKNLKNGSAPGPDGFSICYYKTFTPTLSPYLRRLFNFSSL